MNREQYNEIWEDSQKVREDLDSLLAKTPELFPASVQEGYRRSGSADRIKEDARDSPQTVTDN